MNRLFFSRLFFSSWDTQIVSSAFSPLVLGYVGFRSQYCATAENYSELYGKHGAIVHIPNFLAYLNRSWNRKRQLDYSYTRPIV
jgi:hypothetical protein